jgi:hypothetical protein
MLEAGCAARASLPSSLATAPARPAFQEAVLPVPNSERIAKSDGVGRGNGKENAADASPSSRASAQTASEPPAVPDASTAPTAALDPALTMKDPPRCPKEMAIILDDSCIDRWEASLVQILPGGVEKPWSPYLAPGRIQAKLRAVSLPNVAPQGYISGESAERACRNSGKRLCTAPEWEAACRGPKRTRYPYGETRRKTTCNDDGRFLHPVAELTKKLGLPEDRMWYETMDHPGLNQLPNTLRKTGERSDCTNEYGVYDMVGNLHEWIEDAAGTFRGGFYMDTRINGEGCDYETTAHNVKYHDYSTGFRCCMDAITVE